MILSWASDLRLLLRIQILARAFIHLRAFSRWREIVKYVLLGNWRATA